jgi:hypothetical protein
MDFECNSSPTRRIVFSGGEMAAFVAAAGRRRGTRDAARRLSTHEKRVDALRAV